MSKGFTHMFHKYVVSETLAKLWQTNWFHYIVNSLPMHAFRVNAFVTQTMIQVTWLPSLYLEINGLSTSDIPAFNGTPHCSLLKAVRPK
jgi:hypothetical protein